MKRLRRVLVFSVEYFIVDRTCQARESGLVLITDHCTARKSIEQINASLVCSSYNLSSGTLT